MAKSFNEFYRDMTPFKNWVTYKTDLRKIRFTSEDFRGFADEKLLDVWNRYHTSVDYETLLSIAKTTLYKLPLYLYVRYGKFNYAEYAYSDEKELVIDQVPEKLPEEDSGHSYEELAEKTVQMLSEKFGGFSAVEKELIDCILYPPGYILQRVKSPSKRIPSKLFLEYFGIQPTRSNITKLNRFRRAIFNELAAIV